MASAWAKGLPIVTVPTSTSPKSLTLVYPYYESPRFLARQFAHWWSYPDALRRWFVSAIVVDDGSPTRAEPPLVQPFPIRIFRIGVDVPWNWLAARNIGAHHAADGWLLLTDMDHLVPAETIGRLVWGQHDPKVVYAFSRRESTGEVIAPHSASFFLTRELFWRIGGYDETLSGYYGTDGDFRKRLAAVAPCHVLADPLIRYEFVEDASTTKYLRKQPSDALAVKRLKSLREPGWRPKVLTFPYQEVTC